MIRHAFRRGLTLGLLAGAAMAAFKAFQGRRPSTPAPAPATEWPPLTSVPEPAVDVVVAPGPDPQPARVAEPESEPAAAQPGAHPGMGADVAPVPGAMPEPQPEPVRDEPVPPGPEPETDPGLRTPGEAPAAGVVLEEAAAVVGDADPLVTGTPAPWPTTPAAESTAVTPAIQEPAAEPTVEVHSGVTAETHAGDADRQPETVVPEWQPPDGAMFPAPPPPAPAEPVAPVTKKRAPAKRAAKKTPWVEPAGGTCPASHPVKAKLSSQIFHLPGMLNYERTTPDRCYIDAAAAEADGLRSAKR